MIYHIFEAFHPSPSAKGTLFSKIALRKNHNGKIGCSHILDQLGVKTTIDLKKYLMIHYSQEDLVVIEFTDQVPSIRKESSPKL